MVLNESISSYTNINLPEKPNPIEEDKKNEWVEGFTNDKAKVIAEFLTENITHVTFEEFSKALDDSTRKFMEVVKDRPYVVLVPRDHKKGQQKSEVWVASLAQMSVTNAPVGYVTDRDLRGYLREHPDVKDVAIFDDASYTGERLGNSVDTHRWAANINGGLNMHIVVPFMADKAKTTLEEKAKMTAGRGFKLYTYPSATIRGLKDLVEDTFDEDSLPRVKESLQTYFEIDLDTEDASGYCSSLTYFEHKVPDSVSFPKSLRNGEVRNDDGAVTKKIQFIPDTTPPYKRTDL